MQNSTADSSEKRLLVIHRVARTAIGLVWIYHGLVPKILFRDWSEMTMLRQAGVDLQMIPSVLQATGFLEIGLGALVLVSGRSRWPIYITMIGMMGALVGVARHSPSVLHAAFNPVSLNGLMLTLAAIVLLTKSPKDDSHT